MEDYHDDSMAPPTDPSFEMEVKPETSLAADVVALPFSALGSHIVPVDISGVGREVWLVKVPLVFSELVDRTAESSATLGTLRPIEDARDASMGGSDSSTRAARPGGLSKRRKVRMTFVIDPSLIASLPSDVQKRTPAQYELALDPADELSSGAREAPSALAMAFIPDSGFAVLGSVRQSGTLTAGISDPAYKAHVAFRRQREKELAARPVREEDTSDEILLRVDGGSSGIRAAVAARPPAASAASVPSGMRAASVYTLFEARAYWTLKELADSTGQKEVRCSHVRLFLLRCMCPSAPLQIDVRNELHVACDYMRNGPHRGSYRLKAEFRSVGSALPDDTDAVDYK